ncbi:hypothetical protein DL98DRAFT_536784 [Cadophora sp. DSE1049]|nr:hypothetical protein DL98DRAFT_536784 [Cadophora sp. DSE1049]
MEVGVGIAGASAVLPAANLLSASIKTAESINGAYENLATNRYTKHTEYLDRLKCIKTHANKWKMARNDWILTVGTLKNICECMDKYSWLLEDRQSTKKRKAWVAHIRIAVGARTGLEKNIDALFDRLAQDVARGEEHTKRELWTFSTTQVSTELQGPPRNTDGSSSGNCVFCSF